MGTCLNCNNESPTISEPLGVCLNCIREHFEEVYPHILKIHRESREAFNLPTQPPRKEGHRSCDLCVNRCQIEEGKVGYCGVRREKGGDIIGGGPEEGNLDWYYDSLPTNCVADWVCPGGSGSGYPDFSYSSGPEYGYKNLAVFYKACTFNCLFCQNWHYRQSTYARRFTTSSQLASKVDSRTACICYFGGDPTPQVRHAIATSQEALENNPDRPLRICWETNGSVSRPYLNKMAELSLKSGGCVKFDLKTFDEKLNLALCGITNKRTLDNFAFLSSLIKEGPEPPFLVASTLLVPGYVDEEEVGKIAEFMASLNPDIPYALLGFHPHFYMSDLPTTSRSHAEACKDIAEKKGLKNVRIGNLHLLRPD
jgi:pyruvate formate lyase activating enzyme